MWEELAYGINVVAFVISVLALALYIRDKIKVKPVIQQLFIRRSDNQPPRHVIQALIVNIGEKEAKDCNADLLVNGNKVGTLVFPQIDSPIGRVGRDWAIEDRFTLYPKTPITIRCWTDAQIDDRISVVLKMGNKICDKREGFTLRFNNDNR